MTAKERAGNCCGQCSAASEGGGALSTELGGRHGAGREAVGFILEAKGILDRVIEEYIAERKPVTAS